jgi:predicted ATPase
MTLDDSRRVDVLLLMGPPGSGKSYLGNQLNARGVISYTELEPMLMETFGTNNWRVPSCPSALRRPA